MHTITTIYLEHLTREQNEGRTLWAKNKTKGKLMGGMLLFGGCNEHQRPTNDLYLVTPDTQHNSQFMNSKTGHYILEDQDVIHVRCELLSPSGKGPLPRFGHSACNFMDRYLCIYGGRSDHLYQKYESTVLNDLHLYNYSKISRL